MTISELINLFNLFVMTLLYAVVCWKKYSVKPGVILEMDLIKKKQKKTEYDIVLKI